MLTAVIAPRPPRKREWNFKIQQKAEEKKELSYIGGKKPHNVARPRSFLIISVNRLNSGILKLE